MVALGRCTPSFCKDDATISSGQVNMRRISAGRRWGAAVTVSAGIDGMKLIHSCALDRSFRSPFAIVLMVAASVVPCRWFKKSGWL